MTVHVSSLTKQHFLVYCEQKMKGTVFKPRTQVRGEGRVAQMSTLLNKSYLVKVSTKGGGG